MVISFMMYSCKGVEYQFDYKSQYCADRKNGRMAKMEPKNWAAFWKYGTFIGLVNRKTKEYVAFATNKADNSTPDAPVVPTTPTAPEVPTVPVQ